MGPIKFWVLEFVVRTIKKTTSTPPLASVILMFVVMLLVFSQGGLDVTEVNNENSTYYVFEAGVTKQILSLSINCE